MKTKKRIPMKFYNRVDYVWFAGVVIYCVVVGGLLDIVRYDMRFFLFWVMGLFVGPLLLIWVKGNRKRGIKKQRSERNG